MTSLDMENFIKRLAKTYDSNVRVVKIVTYNETLTMMKAGEIDFIFRAGLNATPELKDKCFWNTSNVPTKNDEKERYDYLEPKVFLIAKGFDNIDLKKIRSQIREIMSNNNEIKKQVERRGQLVFDWDSKDETTLLGTKFWDVNCTASPSLSPPPALMRCPSTTFSPASCRAGAKRKPPPANVWRKLGVSWQKQRTS